MKITQFENLKPDWNRVLNAARRTWGKAPIDKEPSDSWKKGILLAEHSPIRLLEYDFTLEDVRQWVTVHLVRHHIGCEKFVHTQREDINSSIKEQVEKTMQIFEKEMMLEEGWKSRDYMFQGASNDMSMTCNAQAFINISRKRLCIGCASPETRQAWELVIKALSEVDPILASVCVPECVYRGFCPEKGRTCGYDKTDAFVKQLKEYRE